MRVRRLKITNFRSVATGQVLFPAHTVLIGANSVGKSTVCEALDLLLGPDRLARTNAINEHDFHQRTYLDEDGEPVKIELEVVLTDLTSELETKYRAHREYWDTQKQELLDETADPEDTELDHVVPALRIAFEGLYDKEEDEFFACRAGNAPGTKCVTALAGLMDQLDKDGFVGSPTRDWRTVRGLLEKSSADELKKVADSARYLRLLRRGSAIEQTLIGIWVSQGNYHGAEAALEQAILQDQIVDAHRETATIAVMNMHQLKGREYDAVLLVEDQYSTFMAKDKTPPHAETRRLLQVSLTRARHYVVILSNEGEDTFDRLLKSS